MAETIGLIISSIFLVVMLFSLMYISAEDGYKKGQIAALNDKQEYRLVEFEDGTRDYYKESELKDLIPHKVIKQIT